MLKTSAILVFLILASFTVRVYHIGHEGLTEDETLTLCRVNGVSALITDGIHIDEELPEYFNHEWIQAKMTWGNVVTATINDSGNSIGYNIMLYHWTGLFGNTNTSLRMLSLVFGILTVILGYYFCRQLFNERTANIAGVLLCFHPILIEYGQMARSYVPATFFILLTTYSIYQVSVAKKHIWLHIPLYIISLNISLWFHYVTVYVFVSHIFLVALFHSHRKALIQYAVMAICGFGIFSIWLLNGGFEGKRPINIERNMWQHNASINGQEPMLVSSVVDVGYHVALNFVRIFGIDIESYGGKKYGYFLLLLLPFAVVFFVFLKVRKSEYFRPTMFVTFPIVMYVVYIIVMILRTGHSIPFDIRYSTFVMPFACLLLAFGFDRMIAWDKRLIVPGYALIVLMTAVMIAGIFPRILKQNTVFVLEDPFVFHQAAEFIESNATVGDTIFFQSKEDAVLTNLYIHKRVLNVQNIDTTIGGSYLFIKSGSKKLDYQYRHN